MMKDLKHIKSSNEASENLNISDVISSIKCLKWTDEDMISFVRWYDDNGEIETTFEEDFQKYLQSLKPN